MSSRRLARRFLKERMTIYAGALNHAPAFCLLYPVEISDKNQMFPFRNSVACAVGGKHELSINDMALKSEFIMGKSGRCSSYSILR
jgi:hypothetical protein